MILTFSPVRMDETLTVARSGDVLTVNGVALDFGALPPGGRLAQEAIGNPWIAGAVTRDADGTLRVPLILPHGAGAPEAVRFPAPRAVAAGGPVPLPGAPD